MRADMDSWDEIPTKVERCETLGETFAKWQTELNREKLGGSNAQEIRETKQIHQA